MEDLWYALAAAKHPGAFDGSQPHPGLHEVFEKYLADVTWEDFWHAFPYELRYAKCRGCTLAVCLRNAYCAMHPMCCCCCWPCSSGVQGIMQQLWLSKIVVRNLSHPYSRAMSCCNLSLRTAERPCCPCIAATLCSCLQGARRLLGRDRCTRHLAFLQHQPQPL